MTACGLRVAENMSASVRMNLDHVKHDAQRERHRLKTTSPALRGACRVHQRIATNDQGVSTAQPRKL
jgi:hypothetical protein